MANISISNVIGLLVLLLVMWALMPIFNTVIDGLLPQLGDTASLIASLIPAMIILAIVANLWESDEQQVVR